jgi:hypothetical protein
MSGQGWRVANLLPDPSSRVARRDNVSNCPGPLAALHDGLDAASVFAVLKKLKPKPSISITTNSTCKGQRGDFIPDNRLMARMAHRR